MFSSVVVVSVPAASSAYHCVADVGMNHAALPGPIVNAASSAPPLILSLPPLTGKTGKFAPDVRTVLITRIGPSAVAAAGNATATVPSDAVTATTCVAITAASDAPVPVAANAARDRPNIPVAGMTTLPSASSTSALPAAPVPLVMPSIFAKSPAARLSSAASSVRSIVETVLSELVNFMTAPLPRLRVLVTSNSLIFFQSNIASLL